MFSELSILENNVSYGKTIGKHPADRFQMHIRQKARLSAAAPAHAGACRSPGMKNCFSYGLHRYDKII
jgi:hypothetical protein